MRQPIIAMVRRPVCRYWHKIKCPHPNPEDDVCPFCVHYRREKVRRRLRRVGFEFHLILTCRASKTGAPKVFMHAQLLDAVRKFRRIMCSELGRQWECYAIPDLNEVPHAHLLVYGIDCVRNKRLIEKACIKCDLGYIVNVIPVVDQGHRDEIAKYFAMKNFQKYMCKGQRNSYSSRMFFKQTRALHQHEAHCDALRSVASALLVLLESPGGSKMLTHEDIARCAGKKDFKGRFGGHICELVRMGFVSREKVPPDRRYYTYTLLDESGHSTELRDLIRNK